MEFLFQIVKNKNMLINLIRSDFRNRYLGNHLGIIWAFIQPLVMVLVYWFVFMHGFKTQPIDNVPFLVWLLSAMVPWFLLGDAILSSSSAIVSQNFLVKKIVFEVKLLPLVKLGSSILANMPFWLLMLIVCIFNGYYPSVFWLQLIYYFICIIFLCVGTAFLFSALLPFIPDIGQILGLFMQIMFWVTPILWNKDMLVGKMQLIYKLNPFAYITNGIRDTIISHVPIWVHYWQGLYFWIFTLSLLFFANKIFIRLRPHFADVL